MQRAMSSGSRPRIVIKGAGFAGLSAAKALRKAQVDLIVIDRHNYHLFQPLLYQVATGRPFARRHRGPHPPDPGPAGQRDGDTRRRLRS